MSELIVQQDTAVLLDQWRAAERNGVEFPVPFDMAWPMAGYSRKSTAKRDGLRGLKEGKYYRSKKCNVPSGNASGSTQKEFIDLSLDGFKHLCLMAETKEGEAIRQYFIEAEKAVGQSQKIIPIQSDEVRILELQSEILQRKKELVRQADTMITLYGVELGLTLLGHAGQIVEVEKLVTEVVNPQTMNSDRILTAEQLKRAVKQKTGQNLKSMKYFVDRLVALGKHDLLLPVTRHNTSMYVDADRLDEALSAVYGGSKQKLIAPVSNAMAVR